MRAADLKNVLGEQSDWTWVYTDGPIGEPPGAVDSRMRSLKDRLQQAGAPDEDAEAAVSALSSGEDLPSPSARWLLIRGGHVEFDEGFATARLGEECYGHGAFPEVVPLLRHFASQRRIVIVETNREGAEITVERLGDASPETTHTVEGDDQQMTKVQAGGWSHARYQRHAEDVWQRNQSEVAEAVDRVVREIRPDGVFVSGDVRARQLLLDQLGSAARDLVIEVEVETRAPGADDSALDEAIAEATAADRRADLEDAHDRAAAGDAREGATGTTEVVGALQQAQVDTIVLDARMTGSDDTLLALHDSPWIAEGEADAYGVEGTPIDAVEALARAAVLTDARVLFIEDDLDEGEERPDRPVKPATAALRWERDDAATAPASASDGGSSSGGSTGGSSIGDADAVQHPDAAVGHPSQAEGEDPARPDQHRDPRAEGHPSPAEG